MTQNLISYPDLPDFSWLYYERIAARFGLNNKVLKKVSFDIFYQCFYCLCWDIDIHTLLFHHSSSVLCQYFNFYFLKPILKLLLCHINMKKIPVRQVRKLKKKKIREKIYMGRKLKLLEKVIVLWKQCQHLS